MTPAISIASGSSVLTATLTVTGTGQWFLESRDYSVFGTPNDGGVGFFYSRIGEVAEGNGAYVGGLIGFNNLQTTGTVNGQSGFDNGSGGIPGSSTSVGELFITSDTGAAGTFTVSGASPSPSRRSTRIALAAFWPSCWGRWGCLSVVG